MHKLKGARIKDPEIKPGLKSMNRLKYSGEQEKSRASETGVGKTKWRVTVVKHTGLSSNEQ